MTPCEAQDIYDTFAPVYDLYTGDYDHARWLGEIERLARRHGLTGARVIDVACGTGKSALPLARRGYRVDACDISPRMVEYATARLTPFGGRVFVGDMRALPIIGPYDLVTCLDDAMDYLLDEEDLRAALRSFARILAPDGIVVFDVNALQAYRAAMTADLVEDRGDHMICRRATSRDESPGSPFGVTIDVFTAAADGTWRRTVTHHRQRHQTRARLEAAAQSVGLRIVATYGQQSDVVICGDVDEGRDAKVLYVLEHERRFSMHFRP
jgi:SAM-dependent methyltransferase